MARTPMEIATPYPWTWPVWNWANTRPTFRPRASTIPHDAVDDVPVGPIEDLGDPPVEELARN